MSSFTPGPWTVSALSIWGSSPLHPRVRLAVVDRHSPMNGIDADANARLIAAAPELLESLTELKELFRFALLSTSPAIAADGMEFIRKAEAAITKATGGE